MGAWRERGKGERWGGCGFTVYMIHSNAFDVVNIPPKKLTRKTAYFLSLMLRVSEMDFFTW